MQSYLLREEELSFTEIVIHILQEEVVIETKRQKMYKENRKRNQLISKLNT